MENKEIINLINVNYINISKIYHKLKNNGILSIYDPIMNHDKLKSKMNEISLFEFYKRVNHRSDFRKKKN